MPKTTAAMQSNPVPRKTIRKLGLTMWRLIACIALIPSGSDRLDSAFIIKVEKAENSPAIMPLPKHAAISTHTKIFGELSMIPNASIS